jgi:4-amino-4-deoxy-L-arabinose transferase-like glycosyltransferase
MKNKFLLVAMLAITVYGWNYWGSSIYMLDEAKNAGCAVEMMNRGDWVVPTFNNDFHDKPALQYFFMIAAYKMFGVNSFSARFFSVVLGILLVVVVFSFVRRILNEQIAFYSSLLLISSIQMAIQFRLAVPDPYLLFFMVTGLLAFYVGYMEKRNDFLYLFYAFIGLAFLAKGPIAFVLPGLIILIFLIWKKDFSWRTLMSLKLIPGAMLTLAVALPWYIAVGLATDWEWPKYFFITHNFDRYVTTFEGHHGFPFDVVVIVIVALLPVSFFFPQALKMVWKEKKEEPFLLFSLIVCITLTGFFFFSKTVLPSYPAPCVPFAAILLSYFVCKVEEDGSVAKKRLVINSLLFLLLALTLPVAASIALRQDIELVSLSGLGLYLIVAPVGGAVALAFILKDHLQKAFYAYVFSFMLLLILVFTFALPPIDAKNPVSRSMPIIEKYNLPMAYYMRINSGFVFQYGKPIPKLSNEKELQDFVAANGKVLIISTKSDWEHLRRPDFKILFSGKDLFEKPTTVVLTN